MKDTAQFHKSAQFMIQNGWETEEKAKGALQGSQAVLNRKHFNRTATDMVILANPALGEITDQAVRTQVQRRTNTHFGNKQLPAISEKENC